MFSKIVIAADHAGFDLKCRIILYLKDCGIEVTDLGCHDHQSVDYPDYAHKLCHYLLESAYSQQLGILICGTGIGISMAANRHSNIRAAVCNQGPQSAYYARAHNDANVLCMGARLIDDECALATLQKFIDTPFEQGRHSIRIDKIEQG